MESKSSEILATELTMKVIDQTGKHYNAEEVEKIWKQFYKMIEDCNGGDSKVSASVI